MMMAVTSLLVTPTSFRDFCEFTVWLVSIFESNTRVWKSRTAQKLNIRSPVYPLLSKLKIQEPAAY